MKKSAVILLSFLSLKVLSQFSVTVSSQGNTLLSDAYFYTIEGSKDILVNKVSEKNRQWSIKYPEPYYGMMKVYFPEINYALSFVSENKNVDIQLLLDEKKIREVIFKDEANRLMNDIQDVNRKKENLLPVLHQLKNFYNPSSEFYRAIDKEIGFLSNYQAETSKYPFINYYKVNSDRFLAGENNANKPTKEDIIKFISNSNRYLETSALLRPLLIRYLKTSGADRNKAIDEMLEAVNLESPRGQIVLSEFIDLFDTYGMNDLKENYLSYAQNLKCSINDRLASTIETNKKTAVGATFENYTFVKPVNTSAKTLYDIKSDKKVIVFWSSGCSHCEKELPKFIPYYSQLKAKDVEIVGFSLDVSQNEFLAKAKIYPWVNDSELRGWYSKSAEKYNVKATPVFFVLDKNNKIIAKPDRVSDVLSYFDIE